MNALKKINNNVVLAQKEDGAEIFVVGKGLGFRKTPYVLDEKDPAIEKIFVVSDAYIERYMEVFTKIPTPTILVTEEIIGMGKDSLKTDLNDSLLYSLADHINNAIENHKSDDSISNTLHWEIKHIYPSENKIGEKALEIIKKRLSIQLPKEESSFIALHFVNAQLNSEQGFSETAKVTKIIKDILTIVRFNLKKNLDEESSNFARFIIHLRYFVSRQVNKETFNEQSELYEVISRYAMEEVECVKRICLYLDNNYGWHVSNDEQLYLLLHLKRL